jgi:dihydropteroate synthase
MPPLVMGVLNVTPDSFSDGGQWSDPAAAVAHGLEMVAEGADVVDVGGESTRPGSLPVEESEEIRRVVPVVRALAPHVRVSVDTRKAAVAEAAIDAGATLVNDVSATLWRTAADAGAGWVAVHMQGEPVSMQKAPHYEDVVGEVREFLVARAETALQAGVGEVWVDPGFGFGKTVEHNLALLHHLDALVATGYPVLVGTSRKSFVGRLTGTAAGPASVDDRADGSLATAAWAMTQGAAMVRVHDVAATAQLARLQGPERPLRAGDTGPERPVRAGETGPERPVRAGETGARP